eukprot:15431010-Alexandrium_andersonii.AAC.1
MHVSKMYLKNKLSAKETVELVRSAVSSGTQGVSDLARAGGADPQLKHAQRDLMRKLLKDSACPPVYWAE